MNDKREFPAFHPAVFGDILITAVVTMIPRAPAPATSHRLHRDEAGFEKDEEFGWQQDTEVAADQFVEHVKSLQ